MVKRRRILHHNTFTRRYHVNNIIKIILKWTALRDISGSRKGSWDRKIYSWLCLVWVWATSSVKLLHLHTFTSWFGHNSYTFSTSLLCSYTPRAIDVVPEPPAIDIGREILDQAVKSLPSITKTSRRRGVLLFWVSNSLHREYIRTPNLIYRACDGRGRLTLSASPLRHPMTGRRQPNTYLVSLHMYIPPAPIYIFSLWVSLLNSEWYNNRFL